MKKIYNILLLAVIAMGLSSCWDDDRQKAGEGRHQVTELKALPGDCEALLTWTMPQGWNPTDFIITYNDEKQQENVIRTGGAMQHLVSGLANNYRYTFKVQAVYGTLISNAVSATATPATTRFAPNDLAGEGFDASVTLTWTKPGARCTGYTLTYGKDGEPAAGTVELDTDAETATVNDLENDVYYIFTLVAHYPNGDADPVTVNVMPTQAIPYFINRTMVSVGEPVEFKFNRQDLPNATDVTWTFPDGTVLQGDNVTGSFSSANADSRVILAATLGNVAKTWPISVNVREYAILYNAWDGTAYNGFKGSCPVFSPDGKTVYALTFNQVSGLYAFDLESGELTWKYIPETNSGSYNMLTVNPVNGDIYYGTTTAGQFYCVSNQGSLQWIYTGAASMQAASPAVSADGNTVYIGDKNGRAAAIDAATGSEKWNKILTGACGGVLVNGQEILVGTPTAVYFLNAASGNIEHQLDFADVKKGMTDISGFAVASDGNTVYVPQLMGYMSSIDLANHAWKVRDFAIATNNIYEPIVAPNGDVFAGSKDSKWYILDGALTTVKASKSATGLEGKNNAYNYSHPVVDADGNFYITSGQNQNTIVKISPAGVVLDEWSEGSSVQKQMGGNNFIHGILFSSFIGASTENGFLIGKYVGGERASSWSSHGGDICGTCCLR